MLERKEALAAHPGPRPQWGRGRWNGCVEFLRIHVEQADEGIAGEDVEVNVRQRLQLILRLCGGHKRQEEAEPGDFRGFLHDVHAEQVLGDDALLDVVERRGVLGLDLLDPGREFSVGQELDSADNRRIQADQDLHGRYEEGAGTASRVEQAE